MATKEIIIDGYIGAYAYSKQFIRNELTGNSKNLVTVKISSLGGDIDHALNIYDQFIEHGNVTAELSAFIASAATLISLGAKKIRMNENSFYLIHKAMNWIDTWGAMNEDEIEELIAKLEKQKQEMAKITLQLAKMYVKKTGKTLDEIIALMKKETWLTAEEALDWGFVDEIYAPAVATNYLENYAMVAMINANGMPKPPRKSQMTEKPANEPINENTLAEKISAKVSYLLKNFTLKKEIPMKQFLNLNKALNVEKLESNGEGVFLNEEQLALIDSEILKIEALKTDLFEANQSHSNTIALANGERDAAVASLQDSISSLEAIESQFANAITALDAIDATIAAAETPEAKAEAIRKLLAAKPGAKIEGNLDGEDPTPKVNDVDWETIDNLPHNKAVDFNS